MKAAGIDIWKGQWVVIVISEAGFDHAFVAKDVATAIKELDHKAESDDDQVRAIGIDVPIGLPAGGTTRAADVEARMVVGARWPSVFLTPPRDLLEAASPADANAIARAKGWPGISAQAFSLRHGILQTDAVAATDERIYEIHPEVAFAVMRGAPLTTTKQSWNGAMERRKLLAANGIALGDSVAGIGDAGIADVLDAAAGAWSALRIATGLAERIPVGEGRSPAIWA